MTLQSRIWRSKDGGSSFEDITERFNSESQQQPLPDLAPPARQQLSCNPQSQAASSRTLLDNPRLRASLQSHIFNVHNSPRLYQG